MSRIRENRLFLGNPGTGKSTLINCLLGSTQFKSGLSWGGGLTQDYQRFEKAGIAYMDTPGLADETIQVQAAQAITMALKQSGNYKLFFFVRLHNGRVVSEDLVTLERVLDSIEAGDLNYKFTIVINCVGDRQYESLAKRGDEFKTIKTLINRRYLTESFCFVPRIEALEERSNAVVELPREVRDFLDNEAPEITVDECQVRPIAVDGFAAQTQEIKNELERLRKDHVALQRTMREQEKRHDEAMKRMRASHQMGRRVALPSHATVLSPRSRHDYISLQLTPPIIPPNEAATSCCDAPLKSLLPLIVGAFIVITIAIIGVVDAATRRG
jgi:energy-coupling factor transporter ATP-binding protein EcfA2